MDFSNEEIDNFLIEPLRKNTNLDITMVSENDEQITGKCEKKIEYITFDGEIFKTDFYIVFNRHSTSMYTPHVAEAFEFIDDKIKYAVRSSDTYGNVVYEGMLTGRTPKEILSLLKQFIMLFSESTSIKVKESVLSPSPTQERGYPLCDYTINITNGSNEKREVTFENIKFIINGNLG